MRVLILLISSLFLNSMIVLTNRVSIILNQPSLQTTKIEQELKRLNIKTYKMNGYIEFLLIKRDFNKFKQRANFKKEVQNILNKLFLKTNLTKKDISQISSLAKGGKIIFYMPKNCKIDEVTWCYFNSKIDKKTINGKIVFKKSCQIPKNEWVSIDSNVRVSFNKNGCPRFYVTK